MEFTRNSQQPMPVPETAVTLFTPFPRLCTARKPSEMRLSHDSFSPLNIRM
ncbi:hypothetical protein AG1IA_06218 [Rhizoctonia solani AG-1 IA]|uniref:Uncharacterized protein n=1 Tax=Thanatephorus cucumeris (strain AG1-IA) TaxID=983506 RepID=L8WSH4_THACA|nr:hypothetical protein AG1IA_06218 [Rhizoctonia solani AG-1 IA]